ncbi:hypothetical protein HAX54_004218, partial [Datura stramonium]|nr:hypothetical protein [Datura stramonium]
RFKSFQVSALVATDKERQHFSVSLQFASYSACSSSSVGSLISRGLLDHLVFKFGDVINILESLLHTYEASKLDEVIVELSKKVELDLAMEAATVHAEEATMCAEKHALYSTQLESKLEEVVECSKNAVELDLVMEAAAMRAEEAAARAEKHALYSVQLENELKYGLIYLSTLSFCGDKIDIDGNLLEFEDIGHSGSEACNKCQKIDEGNKSNSDGPCWDLITPPKDKRLSVRTDIYCTAEDV